MPTNAEINAWLAQNQGASDFKIRDAMDQYGVSTGQVANATGANRVDVRQRYLAARPGASDINGWLSRNPGASDDTMRQTMDRYGVSPYAVSSATGGNFGQINSRYNAAQGASGAQGMMAARLNPGGVQPGAPAGSLLPGSSGYGVGQSSGYGYGTNSQGTGGGFGAQFHQNRLMQSMHPANSGVGLGGSGMQSNALMDAMDPVAMKKWLNTNGGYNY